jgi:hypothetical protein
MSVRFKCERPLDVSADDLDQYSVEMVAYGEALDYGGDKAVNKAMAAGFKYCLFLGLCLPVAPESLQDADQDDRQQDRGRSRVVQGNDQRRRPGGEPAGDYPNSRPPLKVCPKCTQAAVIVSKPEYGGGLVCYKAKGGCGATWPDETAWINDRPDPQTKPAAVADLAEVQTETPRPAGEPLPADPPKPETKPKPQSDPKKAKFWEYCCQLDPPVPVAAAGKMWDLHKPNVDRACFSAWCESKQIDPEFEGPAWTQYGTAEAAINAIQATLDAEANMTAD